MIKKSCFILCVVLLEIEVLRRITLSSTKEVKSLISQGKIKKGASKDDRNKID
jgi:hypothetical protein